MVESVADEDKAAVAQVAAEFLQEDLPEQQFGAPKAGTGMWASAIRILDPIKVCVCSLLLYKSTVKAGFYIS